MEFKYRIALQFTKALIKKKCFNLRTIKSSSVTCGVKSLVLIKCTGMAKKIVLEMHNVQKLLCNVYFYLFDC